MRFEHAAGYAMGVGLPLLEALRRKTDFSAGFGYADDFIAGALLLVAARAVSQGREYGPRFLAGAWGILCGGLYGSFFYQLESSDPTDVSGLSTGTVVLIKGLLYAIAIAAFVLSVRRGAEPAWAAGRQTA